MSSLKPDPANWCFSIPAREHLTSNAILFLSCPECAEKLEKPLPGDGGMWCRSVFEREGKDLYSHVGTTASLAHPH